MRSLAIVLALCLMNPAWAAEGPSTSPAPVMDEPPPATPDEALEKLIAGNLRFTAGRPKHRHESANWRASLTRSQHPFATILTCADSRVPVELLFDQGFGDIFVIRVAGNMASPDTDGSILYAVAHLHTKVLLVMGHESCGAVTAALKYDTLKGKEPKSIMDLLDFITPALKDIDRTKPEAEQLFEGVRANVRLTIANLRKDPALATAEKKGELKVVGGVYEISTGKMVRVLDHAPGK